MSLPELLKKGLIREVHPDRAKANDLLSKAGKDIKVAEDNLRDGNYDWCLAIAYNSMLSAGRALMELKGYMPLSEAHHLAVVQFCASALPVWLLLSPRDYLSAIMKLAVVAMLGGVAVLPFLIVSPRVLIDDVDRIRALCRVPSAKIAPFGSAREREEKEARELRR